MRGFVFIAAVGMMGSCLCGFQLGNDSAQDKIEALQTKNEVLHRDYWKSIDERVRARCGK